MNNTRTIARSFAPYFKPTVNQRCLSLAVKYYKNGPAQEVYKLETVDDSSLATPLKGNEVSLKILAAPINPSDINLATGNYGIKSALPAVGGNEGVAVVEKIGSEVKSLKIGDWVLPASAPFGTWRQFARASAESLVKVPNDIPAAYAATLAVNPGTAYRLLRDFEQLKPGDVIIQNAANSMVGLAVIQLARELGVKTINVVRADRPNVDETIGLLQELGGDMNITDDYLNSAAFQEVAKELPPIRLALNSVGGENAVNLARALAPGGTLVTYGRMAREHSPVPFDLLTYKQLKLKGFWISQWFATHSLQQREEMLADLAKAVRDQQLTFFFELYDLDDFQRALFKSEEAFQLRKVVLSMDYPDRLKEHDARSAEDYERFDTYAY